ncbi:MAG: hypothetical protein EOP06_23020, partial [Proteobacteria bacterium]
MPIKLFRFLPILSLLFSATVAAQVSKIGYSVTDDVTLIYYNVKNIDTVKVSGNWELDRRDSTTIIYLTNAYNTIGFYIEPKGKKYKAAKNDADALAPHVAANSKKLTRRGWEFDLLATDGASYQLYKIK